MAIDGSALNSIPLAGALGRLARDFVCCGVAFAGVGFPLLVYAHPVTGVLAGFAAATLVFVALEQRERARLARLRLTETNPQALAERFAEELSGHIWQRHALRVLARRAAPVGRGRVLALRPGRGSRLAFEPLHARVEPIDPADMAAWASPDLEQAGQRVAWYRKPEHIAILGVLGLTMFYLVIGAVAGWWITLLYTPTLLMIGTPVLRIWWEHRRVLVSNQCVLRRTRRGWHALTRAASLVVLHQYAMDARWQVTVSDGEVTVQLQLAMRGVSGFLRAWTSDIPPLTPEPQA